MLILSRNIGESIYISDEIVVKLLSINKSQVRLGIKASKELPIFREEVYLKMHLKSMQKEMMDKKK